MHVSLSPSCKPSGKSMAHRRPSPVETEPMQHAPQQPTSHVQVKASGTTIFRLWELFQVELHGRFSTHRMHQMRLYYSQSSWLRVLLVCFLTILPALTVITMIDCVPLASPHDGFRANQVSWIRTVVATTIIAFGPVYHFHCCIPSLPMTFGQTLGVSLFTSIAGVAFAYGVSLGLGYPLPFTLVVQSVAMLPTLLTFLYALWRRTLRDNPSLQSGLRHQIFVLVGQVMMTWIYPLYFFAFTLMHSSAQSVFTLVLPLIKLFFKNYFSRCLRQLNDLKPTFVVFNADLFSALYVSGCLQASRSGLNLLLIMIVDIVQMAISIHDVRVVLREIHVLARLDGSLLDLCEFAPTLQHNSSQTRSSPNTQVTAVHPAPLEDSLQPAAPNGRSPGGAELNLTQRRCLVHLVARALYIAEFLLLIEFVEVMIPVIYSVYLMAMTQLPNRAYYSHLADLSDEELKRSIATVVLNACLELASLIAACVLLWRELRLSTPHLLAFALESHCSLIQTSLVTWSFYVVQQSLAHMGVDFSMRFEWLHTK